MMKKLMLLTSILALLMTSGLDAQTITAPWDYSFPAAWYYFNHPEETWLGRGGTGFPAGNGEIIITTNTVGGGWLMVNTSLAQFMNPQLLYSAQARLNDLQVTNSWLITPRIKIDELDAERVLMLDVAFTSDALNTGADPAFITDETVFYILMTVDDTYSRPLIIAEWNKGGRNGAYDLTQLTHNWTNFTIPLPNRTWPADWDGAVKFAFYAHCPTTPGEQRNSLFK